MDERSQNYAKDTNDSYARDFIEKMALKTKSLVFDMGCGTGSLAVPLAKQGHGVIAADFSKGMLKRLREAAHAQGVLVLEPTIDRQTGTLRIPISMLKGALLEMKDLSRRRMAILAKKVYYPVIYELE